MELIIVGKISVGVRESLAWVENRLGNLIGPEFAAEPKERLETIVFFPTIIDPMVGSFPDNVSYKRAEPAVYLAVNIPYHEWMSGSRIDRAKLFSDALCQGIQRVRDSALKSESRSRLVQGVKVALSSLSEQCP